MILLLLIWQLVSNSSTSTFALRWWRVSFEKEPFYPCLSGKLIGAGTNVCFTGEMIVEHQNNSFPTKMKTCLVKQKCSWKTEPFLLKWPLFRGNVWIMLVFSGVAPPKGGLTLRFDNQCDSTLNKWPKPGYNVFLHRFLKHTCRRFKTYYIITQKKQKKNGANHKK